MRARAPIERRHFVIALEVASMVAIIGLIGWLASGGRVLDGMRPHAAGFVVLVAALLHGTLGGAAAVATTLAVTGLLGWPEPDPAEDRFSYLSRVSVDPALWLAITLLVGELRDRQLSSAEQLRTDLLRATEEGEALARHCTVLRHRVGELEHRIAEDAQRSPADVIEALACLLSDNEDTAARALLFVGRAVFSASCLSVWALSERGLEAVVRAGVSVKSGSQRRIDIDHPLFQAIAVEHRMLSMSRADDIAALEGQGIAAAPIFKSGATVGMLLIEAAAENASERLMDRELAVLAGEIGASWSLQRAFRLSERKAATQ